MAKKKPLLPDDFDVERLTKAMYRCRLMEQRGRSERVEAVRQYVGNHWSEEGTAEKVPLNLISLYIQTMVQSLVAKNPRVMLSTFNRAVKPTVHAMETWANKQIEVMRLANTLQRVTVDALFGVGIAKVALADPGRSASFSWLLRAGQPFVERVDRDDYVYDLHARAHEELSFEGHRYRVPLSTVRDNPIYGKARKNLMPSTDRIYNEFGDERISVLGRGTWTGTSEEIEDMVDLWEVYLPRHRVILTLEDDYLIGGRTSQDGPLREQAWVGPDSGPYHMLGFMVVPGNMMPKGPVQDLMDLHLAANNIYRKIIRTAERMKELLFFQGNASEDQERVNRASDGEAVAVNRPEALQSRVIGGAAIQALVAIVTLIKDLFSFMGGNLELMGGRGPQSKTAKQDEMLNQNAGAGMASMQDRVIEFTSEVLKALCWYFKHDPFNVQSAPHSVNGLAASAIMRQVTPQMRQQVPFEDMDVKVDPYSLQHQTPQIRMQLLDALVQQTIMPMMPLMQQRGIQFDINKYLEKKGQYSDNPDLSELITIEEPTPEEPGEGGDQPGMPQNTERTYNRVSMPGRTTQADDKNLITTALGGNPGGQHTNGDLMANGRPQ